MEKYIISKQINIRTLEKLPKVLKPKEERIRQIFFVDGLPIGLVEFFWDLLQ